MIQVISAALVVEQEEPGHVYKVQRLVYYISKVLYDYETRYNQVQKLLYAIIEEHWSMYFDGSFTLNGVGGGWC
jgi:hypothetical protein